MGDGLTPLLDSEAVTDNGTRTVNKVKEILSKKGLCVVARSSGAEGNES